MLCIHGRRGDISPPLMEGIGRYRQKVFVEHLGWPLPTANGIEFDEFDGDGAVYVACRDESGRINGTARLLPTTAPYLLEKIFRSLWGEGELPHDEEVWELSRFAALDLDGSVVPTHQACAEHASRFFRQVVEVARAQGARWLVTVSPTGIERLMRRNGFRARRAGRPVRCGGEFITSLLIDLEAVDTARVVS